MARTEVRSAAAAVATMSGSARNITTVAPAARLAAMTPTRATIRTALPASPSTSAAAMITSPTLAAAGAAEVPATVTGRSPVAVGVVARTHVGRVVRSTTAPRSAVVTVAAPRLSLAIAGSGEGLQAGGDLDGAHRRLGLGSGLEVLGARVGAGHESGTRLHGGHRAGDHRGADGDRHVHLTGEIEITDRAAVDAAARGFRSEEHTSELQSRGHLVCRLLLEKKKRELR